LPQELAIECGRAASDAVPDSWKCNGRPVRLVDGATIAMPDTGDNQARYPQSTSQAQGLGFPQCRLVCLLCQASGALLDCEISPRAGKGNDEQSGLREQLDVLERDDILIGDAYYCSYWLFCELSKRGVDAVFEQNGARRKKTDFRRGRRLGHNDHVVTLKKPEVRPEWMSEEEYTRTPSSIDVRELRVSGKILSTTFTDSESKPKSAIKTLYWQRWDVELDFRNLKTTMGMNTMSCRTPDMVFEEIWVYLLAYNVTRLLMSQAAASHQLLPRQISFKHTIQMWLAWKDERTDADPVVLFALIAQCRVGNRPGRIEPRAVKRRLKRFPSLTVPRHIARARIMLHGHP